MKFVAGPPFAYYDDRYDFTFFETVLFCVIGGMLGVGVFTFFSIEIQFLFLGLNVNGRKLSVSHKFLVSLLPLKKIWKSIMNLLMRMKRKKFFLPSLGNSLEFGKKYGLIGVAFLTPVIISIPIGTIIANTFEENKKKIFLYMFFSILFWSCLLTGIFELYHVVNISELKERILG